MSDKKKKNTNKGFSIRELSPSFISPEPFRMTLKDIDDKGIFWKKKESKDES